MNISKLALIALLGSALTAFGCSSDSDGGGGSGGGAGGAGGAPVVMCAPNEMTCQDPTINDIKACCDLTAPPTQTAACDGTESQANPETCDPTGTTIEYKLTVLSMDGDCDSGYNLDSCDGNTCTPGNLNLASEGADGVDNGLSSMGTGVEELANLSLTGVEQALSDSLCGQTNDFDQGTCFGGADDGDPCVRTMECVGGSDDGATCIDDTGCTDVQGTCSTTVATMCLVNANCP
ncbi:MAG: hypothetical protein JRE73_16190, partial [Deltaproteobacteria bacterium]|nr:hypothetical protein [Deltaproteobacteria bacterium]